MSRKQEGKYMGEREKDTPSTHLIIKWITLSTSPDTTIKNSSKLRKKERSFRKKTTNRKSAARKSSTNVPLASLLQGFP